MDQKAVELWPQKIRSQVPKTSVSPWRELCRTLSRAVETAVRHRHHHGFAWRPMPLQVRVGQACLRQAPAPSFRTGVLTHAVVQPALGPESSLMEMRDVMFMALSRVSPLFIIYRFHTPAGRGYCGHRPCPEQPQLNPTSTTESEFCCGSARRYCAIKASRRQDAMNGSS
jgi:hypothetical protein